MIAVFIGNDRFLWRETMQREIQTLQKETPELEVLHFDSSDRDFTFDEVEQACLTFSLLATRRFVSLRIDNDKDQEKLDAEQLIDCLKKLDYDVTFYLALAKKPLAKSQLKKYLEKNIKMQPLLDIYKDNFNSWLKDALKLSHVHLQAPALTLFLERTHKDRERILNELEKLSRLERSIAVRDVEALVHKSMEEDIFAFSNALLAKKQTEALRIYHDLLLQKNDPIALMGLIASSLRRSYQVSALLDEHYPAQDIAAILDMSEKQVYYLSKHQYQDPQKLLSYLQVLSELDRNIKRGRRDKYLGFELFMLAIMQS